MRLVLGVMLALAMPAHADRAREIVEGKCFLCHGMQGESASPLFPRMAGQHAAYTARQLADYQAGRRKSSTMQPMVEGLTQADFALLGAYFEAQPTQPHESSDAALAAVGKFIHLRGNLDSGVPACASCHGERAQGSAQLPRLAGQHARYLENQLQQFHTRARTNDNAVMHGIAKSLTALEAKAVSAYLSGLP
jgi:cytochrome c553